MTIFLMTGDFLWLMLREKLSQFAFLWKGEFMARTVGIGIQSFEKIITNNCFYIDKFLMFQMIFQLIPNGIAAVSFAVFHVSHGNAAGHPALILIFLP